MGHFTVCLQRNHRSRSRNYFEFTLVILPTAKVGLPVLGPMAMHFLKAPSRTINDNMEAIPANVLTKVFSNTINSGNVSGKVTGGPSGMRSWKSCICTVRREMYHDNIRTSHDSLTFTRDYLGQFSRNVPYDFINQVIPVIFKVSGQETLDVVTLPYGAPVSLDAISTHVVKIPNDDTTRLRLQLPILVTFVYDMTVNVFPGLDHHLVSMG